jgi:hypothetical protein
MATGCEHTSAPIQIHGCVALVRKTTCWQEFGALDGAVSRVLGAGVLSESAVKMKRAQTSGEGWVINEASLAARALHLGGSTTGRLPASQALNRASVAHGLKTPWAHPPLLSHPYPPVPVPPPSVFRPPPSLAPSCDDADLKSVASSKDLADASPPTPHN